MQEFLEEVCREPWFLQMYERAATRPPQDQGHIQGLLVQVRTELAHGRVSWRYSGKTQKQIVEFVRDNYVKRQTFQSDFPGVGQATSLPGGFSDDEGILSGGGARGGTASHARRASRDPGRDSPASRSYRLCHHEGQGTYTFSYLSASRRADKQDGLGCIEPCAPRLSRPGTRLARLSQLPPMPPRGTRYVHVLISLGFEES
ncbi:FERM, RhoGEF and pleckstrin domain-containing protein 2 [Operophtera brumata]|uniref:FERM, RhoGEF and pleckstrin domain-containing protein 2 n=1 Tax=Operophtera brumata TaxID=104452 RepID=A0A0L7L067_OPEBR|nr:FERM, RhoGEF and pleckstrin domain-containing protein 2 [Operophtera brumata]